MLPAGRSRDDTPCVIIRPAGMGSHPTKGRIVAQDFGYLVEIIIDSSVFELPLLARLFVKNESS